MECGEYFGYLVYAPVFKHFPMFDKNHDSVLHLIIDKLTDHRHCNYIAISHRLVMMMLMMMIIMMSGMGSVQMYRNINNDYSASVRVRYIVARALGLLIVTVANQNFTPNHMILLLCL